MNDLHKYFKGDRVIWVVVILLSVMSLLVVYSSTASLAYKYHSGNTIYYFIRHTLFLGIGLLAIFFVHKIPYRAYFGLATSLIIAAIALLIITWIFGSTKNSATRWITIPGLGMDFQTSDFAKFALIVFIAKTLSMNQKNKEDLKKAFFIIIAVVGLIGLLVFPADLSTGLIIFGTSFILMIIGRIENKFLIATVGVGIVIFMLFMGVASMAGSDTRMATWKNRIVSFADPDSESNFQAKQSKIAIATGSILGKGAGKSTQITVLPHPYSDFVYSIIVEEYGSFFGIGILFMYLILLFRVGQIVKKQQRTFPAFLAIGLMLTIISQALMNMGVAVGILPVTGQTLPLVSMGGTSNLFVGISLGVILNISKNRSKQTKEEKATEQKFVVKDFPFISG